MDLRVLPPDKCLVSCKCNVMDILMHEKRSLFGAFHSNKVDSLTANKVGDDTLSAGPSGGNIESTISHSADQLNSRDLFERPEGWPIETRERMNGKLDRFYHHKKSKKMFRSLSMVKMFVKNINSPPKRATRRHKKIPNDQEDALDKFVASVAADQFHSSSSRTFNYSDISRQHIPTSARARFHIPCAINMFNTRPSAGFGFSGMFEVKGNLWMNEVLPLGEATIQRNSSEYKGVVGKLPLSFKNSGEIEANHTSKAMITKSLSREMVVKPPGKRTRLRTSKTIDMEDKNFTLPEIFYQEDALDEFVASAAVDQFNSRDLFEWLEGWKIETRE